MDRENVADLPVEGRRNAFPQDGDRCRKRGLGRPVEFVDLLPGQARTPAERQQTGRVEDLVGIRVPDASNERLIPQQILQLTGMRTDPEAPDIEGEIRIVGVRPLVLWSAAWDRPIRGAGEQVDLAHL